MRKQALDALSEASRILRVSARKAKEKRERRRQTIRRSSRLALKRTRERRRVSVGDVFSLTKPVGKNQGPAEAAAEQLAREAAEVNDVVNRRTKVRQSKQQSKGRKDLPSSRASFWHKEHPVSVRKSLLEMEMFDSMSRGEEVDFSQLNMHS